MGVRGVPVLKNQLHIERAINQLYNYEQIGTPDEILRMIETVENLQERLKRFEEWE